MEKKQNKQRNRKNKKRWSFFQFYQSTIGKKAVMAVTGLFLFLFVVGHMIGNLKIFMGTDPQTGRPKIDVYGEFLRTVGYPLFGHGELLWIARLSLLTFVVLHIYSAVSLTFLRRKARPIAYAKQGFETSDYASRTMWVGGVLLALYVVYHLLHFTTGTLHFQGFEHGEVYANVTKAFKVWYVSAIYILAMGALGLHIYHGFWSAFQTLGVENPNYRKLLQNVSRVVAVLIFLGYIAVPVAVLTGCLPSETCMSCH